MKYNVSVVKKITLLMMTMALVVAIVACQGAAGMDGKDGKDPGVAPQTVNGGIPDQSIDVGMSTTVDLSAHFTDPNGDDAKLTYTATTSAAATATAEVSGKTLTIEGIKAGMATISVTATDGEGLSTKSTPKVTVTMPDDPDDPDDDPGDPDDPDDDPGENMAPMAVTVPPITMMTGDDPMVVSVGAVLHRSR